MGKSEGHYFHGIRGTRVKQGAETERLNHLGRGERPVLVETSGIA